VLISETPVYILPKNNSMGTSEILIIGAAILLLFGGKKIPEMMKGLGKGVRSFKEAVNGKDEETNSDVDN
jgi:sec-independent protein translocase protein TatA